MYMADDHQLATTAAESNKYNNKNHYNITFINTNLFLLQPRQTSIIEQWTSNSSSNISKKKSRNKNQKRETTLKRQIVNFN